MSDLTEPSFLGSSDAPSAYSIDYEENSGVEEKICSIKPEHLSTWETQLGLNSGELSVFLKKMISHGKQKAIGYSLVVMPTVATVIGLIFVVDPIKIANAAYKHQRLLTACLKSQEKLTSEDIRLIHAAFIKFKLNYPKDGTTTTPENFAQRYVYASLLYVPFFKKMVTNSLDQKWKCYEATIKYKLAASNTTYKSYSEHPYGPSARYTMQSCIFLYMSENVQDEALGFFPRCNGYIIRPCQLGDTQKEEVRIPFIEVDY